MGKRSLSFQLGGMFAVTPGRSTPSESKRISQQSLRSWNRKRNFLSGSLGVVVNGVIPFFISWFLISLLWGKHLLDTISKHLSTPGKSAPNSTGCSHLLGVVSVSFIVLSGKLLHSGGRNCKSSGFHDPGLTVVFLWVWNEFLSQKQFWVGCHNSVKGILGVLAW